MCFYHGIISQDTLQQNLWPPCRLVFWGALPQSPPQKKIRIPQQQSNFVVSKRGLTRQKKKKEDRGEIWRLHPTTVSTTHICIGGSFLPTKGRSLLLLPHTQKNSLYLGAIFGPTLASYRKIYFWLFFPFPRKNRSKLKGPSFFLRRFNFGLGI